MAVAVRNDTTKHDSRDIYLSRCSKVDFNIRSRYVEEFATFHSFTLLSIPLIILVKCHPLSSTLHVFPAWWTLSTGYETDPEGAHRKVAAADGWNRVIEQRLI